MGNHIRSRNKTQKESCIKLENQVSCYICGRKRVKFLPETAPGISIIYKEGFNSVEASHEEYQKENHVYSSYHYFLCDACIILIRSICGQSGYKYTVKPFNDD